MALSLSPLQRPEHRMHTVTIDMILNLGKSIGEKQPPLEHYFSPGKRDQFIRDYIHYLNSALLDAKHGQLNQELYLVFVLSFQFIAPLLEIPTEKELRLFYNILEKNYEVDSIDINLHFTNDEYDEGMVGQEEALEAFRRELEISYTKNREVKQSVQKRLKKDGITAIMRWQQTKSLPELAEAFGRAIVIPCFFAYADKKLIEYYQRTTNSISYEVAVPEFEEE